VLSVMKGGVECHGQVTQQQGRVWDYPQPEMCLITMVVVVAYDVTLGYNYLINWERRLLAC